MELRDFAQQVLFATTLEEKLRCPETLTDERPGPALPVPASPGRPPELGFKAQTSGKDEFPGLHHLEQAHERGRLLHFFANHELLATELMALVLLRFPDAPTAFRRGVLQTLKDEQLHTRLYLERMATCGLQFGEIPVSGYFWRSVSPMESPIDYVAGLSLTFEQANLDFCRHFAQGFQTVGDQETASLLERIYHDEIGHVAYGLKWFRRWKNPRVSDWEAFCRQLKFPLSPQRAKGVTLNVEGRRAAGFDPEFIAQLNVFSQSKGRTPNVFVFNPFAEGYVAQGASFTPVKYQVQLARDLETLPQFLARQDDIVLVGHRPAIEFLSSLKQAGFPLQEFVAVPELAPTGPSSPPQSSPWHASLSARKLGSLRPWAWSPDSLALLQPLLPLVTGNPRSAGEYFNEALAQLYSKAWSANFCREVLARQNPDATPWLCSEDEIGHPVRSFSEALDSIDRIRRRGHHRVVVKEALGLAGRNALRLWEPDLLPAQLRWMQLALQNGRELVVEPWLERELDFSLQLEMRSTGLKVHGYTGLLNDHRGQFQANWAAPNWARSLPAKITARFTQPPDFPRQLQRVYDEILVRLETKLELAGYLGPVGIDAFVYRTAAGDRRIKPIVEINPRCTMGRLTLELMRQTLPGAYGLFRLITPNIAREAGFEDLATCARELTQRFPLRLEGAPVAKIREGFLCLTDPARAQVCLATFQAGRVLDTLLAGIPMAAA